jgi:hypothetical protein
MQAYSELKAMHLLIQLLMHLHRESVRLLKSAYCVVEPL